MALAGSSDILPDFFTQIFSAGFIEVHPLLLVFIGTFLFAELAIIASFVLVAHDTLPFWDVFFLTSLGMFFADFFWFVVGKSFPTFIDHLSWYQKIVSNKFFQTGYIHRHMSKFLIGVKFFYGLQIVTMLYVSIAGLSLPRFIFFDAVGITLYVTVLATLGILAGAGILNILPVYHSFVTIITAVLAALVLSIFIKFVISRVEKKWMKDDTETTNSHEF